VIRAMAQATSAVQFYRDGTGRLGDTWMRDEPSGASFREADHAYADDLDLFGPRSLFQLLSLCRTPMGEARLADWLRHPAPPVVIRERQVVVDALRHRLDLRERVAVINAGRRRFMAPDRLVAWAGQPPSLPRLRPLVVALALACAAALAQYANGGSGRWLLWALVVNGAMVVFLAKRANAIVEELSSSTAAAGVELLANVIAEIEREALDDGATRVVVGRLHGGGTVTASRAIARLARISDWADSRHNVFLRLAEAPFLSTLQIAYACESWRRRHGERLRDWIDAVADMEALLSIAGYAYEHPADPFPDIVEAAEPLCEATDMTHPLLPAPAAVRNSLTLAGAAPSGPQVLLVSGSNMSGKSTLMRTTGINVVLALAGAPVRAGRLRLTPLAVGTCLRHTDSLQEHRSGFYTEALRLRRIADLLDGPLPLLFLFDELLSGTNSKDRRVAAEGVLKTMLTRGAIGMVSTHDLALTEIAAAFSGRVRNVHLQDSIEHGKMTFDYKLRDGVIAHSNAIALMRMIGLDV
jgi:hypothetical protein